MAGGNPSARLAEHRAAMMLAMAEGLSLQAARDQLARQRWAEADARLQRRRQCGTEVPAADRPEQWWQRL